MTKYRVPLTIHANAYLSSDDEDAVAQLAEDAVKVESSDDGVVVELDCVLVGEPAEDNSTDDA